MSSPYNINLSRELVESGLVDSVKITFNGRRRRSTTAAGSAREGASPSQPLQSQGASAAKGNTSLSSEPPYYTCEDPRRHRHSKHPFYVVIRGVEPGIYDCWPCAKEHGKGEGDGDRRLAVPRADTYCEGRDTEDAAREFWRSEHENRNVFLVDRA
ncbi:unnamed protein product [Peniophora sp. CBMAI 1063]|nr:unnamed protein product [Peniophora sp. CBMAI 1063]